MWTDPLEWKRASTENRAKTCPDFMDCCDRFALTSSGCSFCRYYGVCMAYAGAAMTAVKQMETSSHHSGATPISSGKGQEVTAKQ